MDESNRSRAAIGNVDACVALRTGDSIVDATVAQGDMIVLRGWIAGEGAAALRERTVWVEIDGGKAHAAVGGDVERKDVATAFRSEDFRFCGFVAVIPTETLDVGSHTLRAFVSSAGDSAFALPAIGFDVVSQTKNDGAAPAESTRFAGKIDEWRVRPRESTEAPSAVDIFVRGWALDRVANRPVAHVFVSPEAERAFAITGFPRYDVAWAFEEEGLADCGFRVYFSVDDPALAPAGLSLQASDAPEAGWLPREIAIRNGEQGHAPPAGRLEATILADIIELDRIRDLADTGKRFDADFDIDTQRPMFFAASDVRESDPEHSRHYEAVPMGAIEAALDHIPFDPNEATFIDFGCGKGRALVMAALHPFSAIVGVELSPTLAAVARANLERVDRSRLLCDSIEVVEANAAEYELPAGDIVAFFYNPFDETILSPILERLANARCERIAIVYVNPVHGAVIEAADAFAKVASWPEGIVFERRGAASDATLPQEYDPEAYRSANRDLVDLDDEELASHYATMGEAEGRRANFVVSRDAFAALIPTDARVLEIGPYHTPLLRGPQTKYFDVLTRDAMLERAARDGFDGSGAPEIDFVSPTGDLDIVDAQFDCVLSSHSLEHQPDLISHLQHVERLLRPDGRYFIILPDKRYCYDHFNAESGLAEIVEAHVEKRVAHTLRSVLGQSVMSTHNDCVRHWNGDHGNFLEDPGARIEAGVEAYTASRDAYLDVHAWYFTPESARVVFAALGAAGYTSFEVERIYPTRRDAFEFWLVLRKK